jgi:hypothetical protein
MPESKGPQNLAKSLEPTLRHQLESELGADLSNIRVAANHIPGILGGESFVQGNTIFLNAGKVDPNTTAGRELIGHEAAHIVQQGAGVQQRPGDGSHGAQSGTKTADKQQAAVLAFVKG